MNSKLKYFKYKYKYLQLKKKICEKEEIKEKQQIGGNNYKIGDLVECTNKTCLEHIKQYGINENFFIIKEIKGIVVAISRMTPESYLEYKKLDESEKQKFIDKLNVFYYLYENGLRPYTPPPPIRKLVDYEGVFSDNVYMFTGHGLETKSSPNLLLKENQKIILLCEPLCSFYIKPPNDWELVMNSKTSNDFIENLKKIPEISDQLCVFEGSVPDIELYPSSGQDDPGYYRWGLYKIPVLYDFNPQKKNKFLKEILPNLHRINQISQKISIHDLSRNRPYLKITSPHMYHNLNYDDNILLGDVINYLGNTEFTLILFVCRDILDYML